jgi:hypothetical protein
MNKPLTLIFCIVLLSSCAKKYFAYIPNIENPINNCDPLRKHVKTMFNSQNISDEIDCDSLLKVLMKIDPNICFYKLTDSLEAVVLKFPFSVAFGDSNLFVYSVEK